MSMKSACLASIACLFMAAGGCGAEPSSAAAEAEAEAPAEERDTRESAEESAMSEKAASEESIDWRQLTERQWRQRLSPEEFRVLRQKRTERAFTGRYWDNKEEGVYHCAGCHQPLYSSHSRYDSGTGWPSFWAPASEDAIDTAVDRSWFMVRTELLCSRCGGHLGHVFDDGPEPTGKRHCINSASLRFVPKEPEAEVDGADEQEGPA